MDDNDVGLVDFYSCFGQDLQQEHDAGIEARLQQELNMLPMVQPDPAPFLVKLDWDGGNAEMDLGTWNETQNKIIPHTEQTTEAPVDEQIMPTLWEALAPSAPAMPSQPPPPPLTTSSSSLTYSNMGIHHPQGKTNYSTPPPPAPPVAPLITVGAPAKKISRIDLPRNNSVLSPANFLRRNGVMNGSKQDLKKLYSAVEMNEQGKLVMRTQGSAPHNVSVSRPGVQATNVSQMRIGNGSLRQRSSVIRGKSKQDAEVMAVPLLEDDEVDIQEVGMPHTYQSYKPKKIHGASRHPDPVVEHSSLSSIVLPERTYELKLLELLSDPQSLSRLQLEAVLYACQIHKQILPSGERAGFLLGDGPGMGKGRTLAAIVHESFLNGCKRALWVAASHELKSDLERDLMDIGAADTISVGVLRDFKAGRLSSEENGNFKRGLIFATYADLSEELEHEMVAADQCNMRMRQIIKWLGHSFEGIIVLDDCHHAELHHPEANKMFNAVQCLQQTLSMARIVYASAMGTSEPRSMGLMTRLGIFGNGAPYTSFSSFVAAVEKRGIGAADVVAMELKLRGCYMARQLSYKGVTVRVEEVLLKDPTKVFATFSTLWADIRVKSTKACEMLRIDQKLMQAIGIEYWSSHREFFQNLVKVNMVNTLVKLTREATTKSNMAVVIGVQSTGETRTLEHLEMNGGKLTDHVSTMKIILESFMEKFYPTPSSQAYSKLTQSGNGSGGGSSSKRARMDYYAESDTSEDDCDSDDEDDEEKENVKEHQESLPAMSDYEQSTTIQGRILQHLSNNMEFQKNKRKKSNFTIAPDMVKECIDMRTKLLKQIKQLSPQMKHSNLDFIISKLNAKTVAEMTTRRGRVVKVKGSFKFEPRVKADTTLDAVNHAERELFLEGKKKVAIFSASASDGISLHNDKRQEQDLCRRHIVWDMPSSIERVLLQLGRTHRTNQEDPPEIVLLIPNFSSQRYMANSVAKRLQSLGAQYEGEPASDTPDLTQFSINNPIGRTALKDILKQIAEMQLEKKLLPGNFKGDFAADCRRDLHGIGLINTTIHQKSIQFHVEQDSDDIDKFLNRISGCHLDVQRSLFQFFLNKMQAVAKQKKGEGRFDWGYLDLNTHGTVSLIRVKTFNRPHATGEAATQLHTLESERGMTYEQAHEKYEREATHPHEGFYISKMESHRKAVILCLSAENETYDANNPSAVQLQIFRPNTGVQVRTETLASICSRYAKVALPQAKDCWSHHYTQSGLTCSHVYFNRGCSFGLSCGVGMRLRTYHVLSGLMLPVWDRVAAIIEQHGRKMQMVRAKMLDKKLIVGTLVPHTVYQSIVEDLSSDSMVDFMEIKQGKPNARPM